MDRIQWRKGDLMTTVMITGANRGIGLGLVKQYVKQGAHVIACCRTPDKADDLKAVEGDVAIYPLDVSDSKAIASLSQTLKDQPIDILINNAGIYGPRDADFGNLNYDAWSEVFAIDCMAPMRVSEAFVDQVAASERRIIACVTSKMASMGDNGSGGAYIYRSSKAALNAAVVSMSIDLCPRDITCVLLHPGWVQTDMGGSNALIDVDTSVLGLYTVLDHVTIDQTGAFYDYDGSIIPW